MQSLVQCTGAPASQCVSKLQQNPTLQILSRRDSLAFASVISTAAAAAATIAQYAVPPASNAASKTAGDWSTPGLAAPVDDAAPKFFKTEHGVLVQQLYEGSLSPAAKEAHRGDRVLIDFVLRRSNGYFIYGTQVGVSFQPRDVPTGAVAILLVSDFMYGVILLINKRITSNKKNLFVFSLVYPNRMTVQPLLVWLKPLRECENEGSDAF